MKADMRDARGSRTISLEQRLEETKEEKDDHLEDQTEENCSNLFESIMRT